MNSWIDADAVNIEVGGGYIDIDTESFLNAPSIDICFCHECKWFNSKGHCVRLAAECGIYEDVGTDDFCSWGERKDNE